MIFKKQILMSKTSKTLNKHIYFKCIQQHTKMRRNQARKWENHTAYGKYSQKKKYSVIILIEIDFGNENVNRKIYWHFQKHA